MNRRSSLKKNVVLNVAGSVIPLAVAIVTVPLYLNSVGAARFGVLSLVWLFAGYFSLLDFGISRATVNMVARTPDTNLAGQQRVLWSALWINGGFGLIGMVLVFPLAHYIFGTVRFDDPGLREELIASLPWLCLTVPLTLASAVLQGGLEARERFGVLNTLNVIGGLAVQLVPVWFAYQVSVQLDVLIPAIVCTRFVLFVVIVVVVHRSFPLGPPLRWDRDAVRGLVSFGSWASVSGIISPVLEALDRFVIGAKLSATDVALYAVPFSIADKLRIVPRALVRAAYPRLSGLPDQEALVLYRQLVSASLNIMTPVVLGAVVTSRHLLELWIGAPRDSVSGVIAIVLVCGAWLNSMALLPFVYIQSRGRPNVTAIIHGAEFVPFVLMLFWLTTQYGVVGAALAWAGRMLMDCVLLCLYARGAGAAIYTKMAVHGLVIGVAAFWAARTVLPTWAVLALALVICIAFLALNYQALKQMLLKKINP
jgi:O-antigen/teichoic acid export membrane protein